MISRILLSLPNAYKLMCFDRNINGKRDVKFLIGIIGHCTDQRNLLYQKSDFQGPFISVECLLNGHFFDNFDLF